MTIEFDSDTRPRRDDESLLDYYLDFRGQELEASTKEKYKTAWTHLQRFLEQEDYRLPEMTKTEASEWCEFLRTQDLQENVAERYVDIIRQIIDDLKQTPEVGSGNPFQEALDTDPFSYDDSTNKLEVPLDVLRRAIHPSLANLRTA